MSDPQNPSTESRIERIYERVFNGLGAEIRKEVREEVTIIHRKIGGLYKSIGAILVALLLTFAALIIEGRISTNQASSENDRNYKAIVDIDKKIDLHIIQGAVENEKQDEEIKALKALIH